MARVGSTKTTHWRVGIVWCGNTTPAFRPGHRGLTGILAAAILGLSVVCGAAPTPVAAAEISGTVSDATGRPVAGTMVSARHIERRQTTTVFSDASGAYVLQGLDPGNYELRARQIGFDDVRRAPLVLQETLRQDLALAAVPWQQWIHQLPASEWFRHVKFSDPALRGEFAVQCAMCHQQGSILTRLERPDAQWQDIFDKMAQMGAIVTERLRAEAAATLNAGYARAARTAPALPAPVTGAAARATIREWDVGLPTSMLHDVGLGPDGRVYAVDWIMDKLFRLDPTSAARAGFDVPRAGTEPGGAMRSFARRGQQYFHFVPHVAPHSLQTGPDGGIWITLSLARGLARFDPVRESFTVFDQPAGGMYAHTNRFDARGRAWYTLAMSNQVAMFDPRTETFAMYDLPTRSWSQAFFVETLAFWVRAADYVTLKHSPIDDPELLPIAYGIDIAPDGGVWFSQFNNRRIGRIDPETGAMRTVETPFFGPRRMRFDPQGDLWIPAYADGKVYRFDPRTNAFTGYDLPTGPGDMPYAVAIDRRNGDVWICGTNSDTLIRFRPAAQGFTVFPLPNRVTFTREIEVDARGHVWTSSSNMPGWQIEGGQPTVIELIPGD